MPLFPLPEHKIGIFVRFYPSEPPFSGISSTKSGFLCVFALRSPRFRASRAQNRGFCALLPVSFSRLCFLWAPCQQHLPDGYPPQRPGLLLPDGYPPQRRQSLRLSALASNIFPMALCHGCASHKELRHSAPASNKPHPAEKSTPVWLAIWHIWAGFANSQQQCVTFRSNYSYKCTSTLLPHCNRCSDIANLSAHLHRLPTPPTYLRRMRLPPGRGAGIRWMMRLLPGCMRGCWVLDDAVASQGRKCWMANDAAGCPWHSSCKSPRARILVLGTSGAHWPARWPQFELTERVAKS